MQQAQRRLRVSPSLVISVFALVIAMSAGAYAVTVAPKNSVVSNSIKNKNVKAADIKPGAVRKKHLGANSVDSTKIINGQVTSLDIADGQIGATDFAPTALGNYYTKAEADGRYAPLPGLIRGTTMQAARATGAGQNAGASISYGVTLSAPPTAHYIALGALLPEGCSGTSAAPNAAAGHLCVFEVYSSNNSGNNLVGPTGEGEPPSAFGGVLYATSVGAGEMVITTNWAVRPVALAPPAAPAHSAKTNVGRTGGSFLP